MDKRSLLAGIALGVVTTVVGDRLPSFYGSKYKAGENVLVQRQDGLITSITCRQVLLSNDPETKGISLSAKTVPIPGEGGTVTETKGAWNPGGGYMARFMATDNGKVERDDILIPNSDTKGEIDRVVRPMVEGCSKMFKLVPGMSG